MSPESKQSTPVRVSAPTFEHHVVAFGIGETQPRLSWAIEGPDGWSLERADVELSTGGAVTRRTLALEDTVLVGWPFEPLTSRQRAAVRVRGWGGSGEPSLWSAWSDLEVGLLSPLDWTATAIGHADREIGRRPVILRGSLAVTKPVSVARLYATALGVFDLELNGVPVGHETLAPGWTSYHHRLRYSTHDVTDLVREGENVLGAWLADGWYRGRLGFDGGHVDNYGSQTAVIAQLVIEHPDGTVTMWGTDRTWSSSPSPIISSGLLEGECHDARAELPGWSTAPLDPVGWAPVAPRPLVLTTLVAPDGPPIRRIETIGAVSIEPRGPQRVVVDFGQNLVGRVRLSARAPEGHRVRIRHAEVLEGGELCVRPLRGATSIDEYTFAGKPSVEVWEPRFTIHGFRYCEVSGWDMLDEPGIEAVVIHTDMERTGWFACSDPLLSRFHENVVWSMRGNFVGLPTDCPQRDERLGWTGDIQVFAPTATFLYDCYGVFRSWLADVVAEQLPDGTVPWYVPYIPGGEQWTPPRPGAGWGDVIALTPFDVYQRFGDLRVAGETLDGARRWVQLEARLAGADHVWDSSYQLGDWLDPTAPPDDPADGLTDRHLVATAYFARSASRVAELGSALGVSDAEELWKLASAARRGFRARYVRNDGRLTSESQTSYSLAIVFGLFDTEEVQAAGRRLATLVEGAGLRLTTGFLGTPVILDALTRSGQRPLAYRLVLQPGFPSWLWPVTQGATTIWERWDSLTPAGHVNEGQMTSFNHYAFGSVADWLHREVAGLASAAPGWKSIRFRPGVESGLTWARAAQRTPRGEAAIRWRIEGDVVDVEVVVPVGADAVLELPDGTEERLESGVHRRRPRWSVPATRTPSAASSLTSG